MNDTHRDRDELPPGTRVVVTPAVGPSWTGHVTTHGEIAGWLPHDVLVRSDHATGGDDDESVFLVLRRFVRRA